MPAKSGRFWLEIAEDNCTVAPSRYRKLQTIYPDEVGGVDLQPFFDLVTVHELGHAFEVLSDLPLPKYWLSEIFVNFATHTCVATKRPESLVTLEVLPTVGAGSRNLTAKMLATGPSTLDELQAHYTGGDDSMSRLNCVSYWHRWFRLVSNMFDAGGEAGLVRFWEFFHGIDRITEREPSVLSVASLLGANVSGVLGCAVRKWYQTHPHLLSAQQGPQCSRLASSSGRSMTDIAVGLVTS